MSKNIEQLLRLAADFKHFCEDDGVRSADMWDDSDALCEEDLFLVAAAAKMPEKPELPDHPLTRK